MSQVTFIKTTSHKQKNTLTDIYNKSKNYTGLDKYYTREGVVRDCLSKVNLEDYDCVIEPSAGNGAFYTAIDHPNKIGLDIEPEHADIHQQDWLTYEISPTYKNILLIGNPPFGVLNTLSTRFLMHAFRFSNVKTIAFILPNVYHKHTKQKIIPPGWRIKHIHALGRNSFTYEEEVKHVPCSFFVLDRSKGKDLRFLPEKYTNTKDFYFGTKDDFDIFVFGGAPRRLITEPKANHRGYFLKSRIALPKLIDKFKKLPWKGNSCASGGVFWLTKAELCYEYTQAYHPDES